MKELIRQRMTSDEGASQTVETIIIIALAVFAALALVTWILRPTTNAAQGVGESVTQGVNSILQSDGDVGNIDFSGSAAAGGGPK